MILFYTTFLHIIDSCVLKHLMTQTKNPEKITLKSFCLRTRNSRNVETMMDHYVLFARHNANKFIL